MTDYSKAQKQAYYRWRKNTPKKRIELFLDEPVLDALNAKTHEWKCSRAEVIARLLGVGESIPRSAPSSIPESIPVSNNSNIHSSIPVSSPDSIREIPNRHIPVNKSGRGARAGEAQRRAESVAKANELRQQGLSWKRIAEQFNADGIPTLRGGRWDASTIQHMVRRAAK